MPAQVTSSANGPITTDRPDVTESAFTVGKGVFQLETSTFFTESKNDGIKTRENVFNTSLLRYGVLDNLELRLGWDYVQNRTRSATINDTSQGTTPMLLGLKIGVVDEKGLLPQIAFFSHLFVPFTASSAFKPESTGMQFFGAFEHTFNSKSGIGYNLGMIIEPDANQIAYTYTLAYAYDLTPKLGAYIEVYGDFPEHSRASHLFDGGFTYLVNDNLQLDISAGAGIVSDQTLLASVGLSYRIFTIK